MLIESRDNQHIKAAKALQTRKTRDREGLFLLEGTKMVSEALACPGLVETIFHVTGEPVPRAGGGTPFQGQIYEIAPRLAAVLTETETPQGVFAVCRKPAVQEISELAGGCWLLLDGIQDPGNLGTMLRTAWAVGVDGVILTSGCVDPYNAKSLRAGMGATFRLPLLPNVTVQDLEMAKQKGYRLLACLSGGQPVFAADLTGRIILAVGSEGSGLTEAVTRLADGTIGLPLAPGVDSLNAAVAAGVVLYEAWRQRNLAE